MVRHSANFILLNRAILLRLVLSTTVTVMSSEICERAADSNLRTAAMERIGYRNIKRGKRGTAGDREQGKKEMSNWRAASLNVSAA